MWRCSSGAGRPHPLRIRGRRERRRGKTKSQNHRADEQAIRTRVHPRRRAAYGGKFACRPIKLAGVGCVQFLASAHPHPRTPRTRGAAAPGQHHQFLAAPVLHGSVPGLVPHQLQRRTVSLPRRSAAAAHPSPLRRAQQRFSKTQNAHHTGRARDVRTTLGRRGRSTICDAAHCRGAPLKQHPRGQAADQPTTAGAARALSSLANRTAMASVPAWGSH